LAGVYQQLSRPDLANRMQQEAGQILQQALSPQGQQALARLESELATPAKRR
jgi:hypothetical protein